MGKRRRCMLKWNLNYEIGMTLSKEKHRVFSLRQNHIKGGVWEFKFSIGKTDIHPSRLTNVKFCRVKCNIIGLCVWCKTPSGDLFWPWHKHNTIRAHSTPVQQTCVTVCFSVVLRYTVQLFWFWWYKCILGRWVVDGSTNVICRFLVLRYFCPHVIFSHKYTLVFIRKLAYCNMMSCGLAQGTSGTLGVRWLFKRCCGCCCMQPWCTVLRL